MQKYFVFTSQSFPMLSAASQSSSATVPHVFILHLCNSIFTKLILNPATAHSLPQIISIQFYSI